MLSLIGEGWNIYTFLDLYRGLLDHSEEVRAASMEALQEVAKRGPEPIKVTPLDLLSDFLFSFTVTSGIRLHTFRFFVELGTPEAHQAIDRALSQAHRNEDFSDFVGVLQRANQLEPLRHLDPTKLSKTKAAILRAALEEH